MACTNASVRTLCLGCIAAYGAVLSGCNRGPSRIVAPSIDASGVAAAAMAQCEKDGDGALTKEELAACPAILSSLTKYDANHDGQVTAEEIETRVESWSSSGVGITAQTFFVRLDGRPLAGARVELIPEPFFDDVLFPAESGVGTSGMCSPGMAQENLPEGVPTGIYCGLYRVKVTHPEKAIAARYNERSELGIEVCPDYDIYNPLKFELTSK